MRERKVMSWVRARLRLGSWIALFAVAFQLAVSFGHVHLDAGSANPSVAISAPVDATPATGDPSERADHYCPVCALIHFAGALVLTQPPVLPLPVVFVAWRADVAVKFGFTSPPPSFFPARAPPTA
jgi:hypothetical protein